MSDEPTGPGWRERLVVLPWKRISLIAAGLFAAAVLAITAFELVAGQSVSSFTGGTEGGGGPTIGRILDGSDGETSKDDNEAPSDDSSSPSDAPSDPDQPAPTNVPTGEPTPAPESPAPAAPTTSETALPTDAATTPPTG